MAWKPLVVLLALAWQWWVPGSASASSPPGAPTNVLARAAIGCALVSWTPPASSGSSPITSYDVVSQNAAGVVLSQTSVPATQTSAVMAGLFPSPQTFTVDAVNASGAGPASLPSAQVTVQAGGTYHPLSPVRILDTRQSFLGRPPGPLGPGETLQVPPSVGGFPATGVSAVVLNVTVTDTTAAGFLTMWPTAVPMPVTSSVNWTAGATVPNLVEVPVRDPSGISSVSGFDIFNSQGFTDVVLDLEGYVGDFTNSTGRDGMFNVLQPARLMDTRSGTALGAGGRRDLQVAGGGGVPSSGVSAVVLNVTATAPTASSFLTVWPAGEPRPQASNLNFTPGQTVPNRVVVKLGAGGAVSIFNLSGSVDVVVDVNGWFTDTTSTAGGSGFMVAMPTRIFDSRDTGLPLTGGETTPILYQSGATAAALVLNVTATDVAAPTFLTLFPDGAPRPPTSDLNPTPGQVEANLTVVGARQQSVGVQAFDVFVASGSLDVVIDVSGFYTAPVPPLM